MQEFGTQPSRRPAAGRRWPPRILRGSGQSECCWAHACEEAQDETWQMLRPHLRQNHSAMYSSHTEQSSSPMVGAHPVCAQPLTPLPNPGIQAKTFFVISKEFAAFSSTWLSLVG